jgi:hypothetical protein
MISLDLNVDICTLIRQSRIYGRIDGSKDKQINGQSRVSEVKYYKTWIIRTL